MELCFRCTQLNDAAEPETCSYVQRLRTTGTEPDAFADFLSAQIRLKLGGREGGKETKMSKMLKWLHVGSSKQPCGKYSVNSCSILEPDRKGLQLIYVVSCTVSCMIVPHEECSCFHRRHS